MTKSRKLEERIKQAETMFKIWYENRPNKSIDYAQCKSVPYWFVADKGEEVLSFYDTKAPRKLSINYNEHGRAFVVSGRSVASKTHYIHRLQAEAFPERVYAYGKAKEYDSLDGLEVHHIEGYEKNEPEYEEVLERHTHKVLFDKRIVPNVYDEYSKQFEYMEKVLDIVNANTPEQTVVVFSGSGLVNGKETKDLGQTIYANDMQGVDELAAKAIKFKGNYIMYIPESTDDRAAYKKLLNTPGEAEKLESFVIEINQNTKQSDFYTTYNGINLFVKFLKFK